MVSLFIYSVIDAARLLPGAVLLRNLQQTEREAAGQRRVVLYILRVLAQQAYTYAN
jgi:hypothetical protein